MRPIWFVMAVLTLLLSHIIRTIRWRVILSRSGVEVSNTRPLAALSVGYLINTLLPLRLGELVRTGLLSYTVRTRFSTVLATVFVERLIDLAVLILLFVALIGWQAAPRLVSGSLITLLALGTLVVLLARSTLARRVALELASLFNENVKSAILHFCYLVTQLLFKPSLLTRGRFWALTVAMWGAALASLGLFAVAAHQDFAVTFLAVYGDATQGQPTSLAVLNAPWLLAYLTLPIPIILIYAYLSGFNALAGLRGGLRAISRLEVYGGGELRSRSQTFNSLGHYNAFLDRHYRGHGGLLSEFEQRGIEDVLVHRVFHGGSGAITALVEVSGKLRVRKFATGALGAKLRIQREWLRNHCAELPLVEILETRADGEDYFYDMAFIGGSRDLYEGIHSEPVGMSTALLDDVIERMSRFHASSACESASDSVVADYIASKVLANYRSIRTEFQDVIALGWIDLNGEPFDLDQLRMMEDPKWFLDRLTDRRQSSIHGDLTIENIMLEGANLESGRWFLIDPNPVNGFQSPLIDFAKLMQSLHLGYEALHKAPRASLVGNRLTVGLHRSFQYESIYRHTVERLTQRLGANGMQQVYLHELINYLRLIPYQLRANREAGLAFFGGLCLLVREFHLAYPAQRL
ncbi:flippase-like domain-containing protein [Pseudoxanthomonas winnipegensis]|uniref:lysylphosphatidylglycerol synthase transmembrane domain-containing protein n=1 Tax=Pseudoxanthomonas winnipegensis TaxID=2480810 RepID=UPI00102D8A17|nr:lysylphosphatidylglycerol synthase transmembrane domain-containing protein [Pseudoxanthomonas winnipegensis]TAA44344.1 flippase-like domain-containing protein [Pseudoxanthomonas winnipegensis]